MLCVVAHLARPSRQGLRGKAWAFEAARVHSFEAFAARPAAEAAEAAGAEAAVAATVAARAAAATGSQQPAYTATASATAAGSRCASHFIYLCLRT